MVSKKHLVLDDDVYLKLQRRKARTKLSEKAIGNSILRRVLSRPPLSEAIGEKLVEMGKVSKEEYEQAVTDAIREIQKIPAAFSEIIEVTNQHTFTAGSWELKELCISQDRAFQVLEYWARDDKKVPLKPHSHTEFQYFIVVTGRVQIQLEEEPRVLGPTEFLGIPPGKIHSSVPLTKDARMLVITTPALLLL